ncbi:hypothetical protein BN1058_02118 [Paraliobacillus sp. PM-2]|uniref:DUF881 domain-containing protein n=1 Tax=Paraliobacillus sp. PM-2 TaxID=1462524 RepID=UPI00061C6953|nr:DUF881 domain-containing protein [Paraliobacillus sp. PM-2]CQR47788.1 hypothetical protein BN1058_02118 [Paraliobacillus sp. PM-2]
MKLRGRHVIMSLVLFVFGFLVAYSYQYTKQHAQVVQMSEQEWEKDFFYRQQLIQLEEKNRELQDRVDSYRKDINHLEKEFGNEKEKIREYVEQKKKLQMITGELPIQGSGVKISLKDADYIPSEENANQYMVHDRHVQLVINELYSAGAKAIAINGERIFKNSFINCVGPVITIDGNHYPAPFVIEAIGDIQTLRTSLELTNGVVDILVNENIEVKMENIDRVQMDAKIS